MRQKLEEILALTGDLEHWLSTIECEAVDGKVPIASSSPLAQIKGLQKMYFPQTAVEILALERSYIARFQHTLGVATSILAAKRSGGLTSIPTDMDKYSELYRDFSTASTAFTSALLERYAERIGLHEGG